MLNLLFFQLRDFRQSPENELTFSRPVSRFCNGQAAFFVSTERTTK